MSSFTVENLLRNRLLIKNQALYATAEEPYNMDSDEFNDLIVIEKKIKELYDYNLLSDFDMEIIEFVSDGKPLSKSKDILGKDRTTISKNFSVICERIAYFLGGYFTNEGLIEDLKERFNLNEEQIQRAHSYIYSNRKG